MLMYPDDLRNWFNFGRGLLIFLIFFFMSALWFPANPTALWWLRGATAIRSLDLLVHLHVVTSKEMEKENFRKLSSYWAVVISDYCVVRLHDDVIKWKHFPRHWPFVWGIHRSPVNSPHKGQWRGALMFSLICVSIKGWVNNCEAGDLRRHHAHYDFTVMFSSLWRRHENMSPCTGSWVNDNYESIVSQVGAWFWIHDLWISRHILPSTVVSSVLTIWPFTHPSKTD